MLDARWLEDENSFVEKKIKIQERLFVAVCRRQTALAYGTKLQSANSIQAYRYLGHSNCHGDE